MRLQADADAPFRIASRQYIDFVGGYNVGLAKLRKDLQWLHSPEGELRALEFRLKDALRDFERATDADPRASKPTLISSANKSPRRLRR